MVAVNRLSTRARQLARPLLKASATLAVVAAATLLFSLSASAAVTFAASEIASGASSSNSIVSGDFNNDGIIDLVTCNGPTISFYKGLGSGKYAAPINTTVPNGGVVSTCAAADFNRDGKLDIAAIILGPPDGMSVFLGDGAGSFTQKTTVPDAVGLALYIATGDFNGDHIPDVAFVSCYQPNNDCYLQVELGIGDGTFQQSAEISFFNGIGPIVVGDFNEDGHQDIAGVGTNGLVTQVLVLLGEGNGQFQNPITYSSTSQYGMVNLAEGDFYSTRVSALAVVSLVNNSGNVTAYVQTVRYSKGVLVASSPQVVLGGLTCCPVQVGIAGGDVDGDFKDDIVVAGYYGNTGTSFTGYMLGTGKGTFGTLVPMPKYGSQEATPFIRDLNLDSRHDVGIDWSTSSSGGALVLLNTNAVTNCTPPTAQKLGVHICAPTPNEIVPDTFTFKAAGNAFNGVAKRMELWIDGTKVGASLDDQLKLTRTLTSGNHKASFVVVDWFGNKASASVNFTAQ